MCYYDKDKLYSNENITCTNVRQLLQWLPVIQTSESLLPTSPCFICHVSFYLSEQILASFLYICRQLTCFLQSSASSLSNKCSVTNILLVLQYCNTRHIAMLQLCNTWQIKVKWHPCHQGMICSDITDGADILQVWWTVINMLDIQLQSANKGWSSSLKVGHEANYPIHKKTNTLWNVTMSDLNRFACMT